MSLNRISIKYFVRRPETIDPGDFIPVFQKWIQNHTVEGLLIDVVDYKHVYQGPGVILIGHEVDYAFDLSEGRPGLLYTRKRALQADLRDALHDAFRLALIAAEKIESDGALHGISFDTSEVIVSFHDRLLAPNKPETLDLVREDVSVALQAIYGDANFEIELASDDPRHLFSIRVVVPKADDLPTLIARLDAGVPVSS
ncbi:MAG: hypothetical protein D6737_03535 [Chloroflexi bacterium]|nr:MAG: hypothetical protein CUN54_07235 [Phototrophicales bacterium]RMF81919.1 MAG: hypothetical protein D6737_03535 [Chloroflexota bacterium]